MNILNEKSPLRMVFKEEVRTPAIDAVEEVATPTYDQPTIEDWYDPLNELSTILVTSSMLVEDWYDPLDELPTITVASSVPSEDWYGSLDELPTVTVVSSTPAKGNKIVRTIMRFIKNA